MSESGAALSSCHHTVRLKSHNAPGCETLVSQEMDLPPTTVLSLTLCVCIVNVKLMCAHKRNAPLRCFHSCVTALRGGQELSPSNYSLMNYKCCGCQTGLISRTNSLAYLLMCSTDTRKHTDTYTQHIYTFYSTCTYFNAKKLSIAV